MTDLEAMEADLADGYPVPVDASGWLTFGRALDPDCDTTLNGALVGVPMSMLNRHGLVAGATGTGKTKTLQLVAEQLSAAGVPVLLADLKGDLTGLAEPGPRRDFIDERMAGMELPWAPSSYPVELLSLTGSVGTQVRVPLSDFGPLLLAKVLDATEVQESVLQVVFQYAADAGRTLATIGDLSDLLRFLDSDEGEAVKEEYGGMSGSTISVLRRELVALRGQGGDALFDQPGFDVGDLRRRADDGRGIVSIVHLADVQTRPRLFSTFLLWLLSSVYAHAPEVGDVERPELVFFFDEAHLLFDGASPALMDLVELTVRMIRSKGIGVFFVTQQPTDVPDDVLGQLGTRVQHALRAFTPDDQKALRSTAATFPITEHYDVRDVLTSLGIGEALVTGLGEDGAPTPTAAVKLVAPTSNMDPAGPSTLDRLVAGSELAAKYAAGAGTAASAAAPAEDEGATEVAEPAAPPAGAALRRTAARWLDLERTMPPSSTRVRELDGRTGRSMNGQLRERLVAGEVGELAIAEDGVRFVSSDREVGVERAGVGEVQAASGVLVLRSRAGDVGLGLDDDDLLDVLDALFPDGHDVEVGDLPAAPGDLGEVERPEPAERPRRRAGRRGREDEAEDDGPGVLRQMASSPVTEEAAAFAGKLLGINKGTTRSLFRSIRKASRG